jgi:L-lactate dehydrogenase complex protein LldG
VSAEHDDLAERFAAALKLVGGVTVRAVSHEAALEEARRVCGDRPVVVDDDPVLSGAADGLRTVDDPWTAEVGVSTARAAVAETGSLAVTSDAAHPRSTSLVPPVHVAVVPEDRLVNAYPDAINVLAALNPTPSGMSMITGTSSTGDIEMILVRGVHGPQEVHVILYPAG